MKKLLTLFVAMIMVCSAFATVAFAADPTIVVSNATFDETGVATVTVSIANNPGLYGFGFDIAYDESAMTLTKVEGSADISGDFTIQSKESYPSPFYLLWGDDLAPDPVVYDGVIATLTFVAVEGVAPGDYNVEVTQPDDGSTYGDDDVFFTAGAAKVTVPSVEAEKEFTVAAPVFGENAATCAVVNTEDTDKDIILVVAEYKDKELVALNVSADTLVAAGTESATLTAAYTAAGTSAKAFVLNNLTDCVPYVAAVTN